MGSTEARVIVFGNEKGGSGKSTAAMQTAIALLRSGYSVATIDLDARQGTLTRYMKNRWAYIEREKRNVPVPIHMDIENSKATDINGKEQEERNFLYMALDELRHACDFIVIDTPGADTHLSRLAHSQADTIVTPLNDSLIDLDVLARIDPQTKEIKAPSIYTRMVEDMNVARVERGDPPIHWIVMRNRLSHLRTKNREDISVYLKKMSDLFGFQFVSGFGERVVFKELFLSGLTLLDLREEGDHKINFSELTARQEVRSLVCAIAPELTSRNIRAAG